MKKVRAKGKKDENRNQKIIIGLIIAFIMVSSVLGYYGAQSKEQAYTYKGIKFTAQKNGLLLAKISNHDFYFNYLPQSLVNMSFNSSVLDPLKATKLIYTTSDIKSPLIQSLSEAEYLLTQELMQLSIYSIGGYTTNTTTGRGRITCDNATAITPVIMFEYANKTSAYLEGQCLHIAGNSRLDLLALKDRMLYGLLGILR